MTSQTIQQNHLSLLQQHEIHTRVRNKSEKQFNHGDMISQQRRQLATSYLTLVGPNDTAQELGVGTQFPTVEST